METLVRGLIKKGYSKEAAKQTVSYLRDGSKMVYDSRWNRFAAWCNDRFQLPEKSSEAVLAEFIIHLGHAQMSSSTITGYVTAISQVVKLHTGKNLATSTHIQHLVKTVTKGRPIANRTPSWDLSTVLSALGRAPYEPMESCSMTHLTHKTAFLLLLAAGCRRSELHALQLAGHEHDPRWRWVKFYPHAEFLAKTQLASTGSKGIRSVSVQSLSDRVGPDMEERLLCPVRAVRIYMRRTKDMREGKKALFVSIRPGIRREICRNTISGWVVKTIHSCYEATSLNPPEGVRAHDVRSQAASLAFADRAALEDIMQACTWKTPNSFISYYLKDLTAQRDGLNKLGPLVAAGRRVGRR